MKITRKNRPDLRELQYPLRFTITVWFMYFLTLTSLLTAPSVTVSTYDKILRAVSDAVLPLGTTFVLACRLLDRRMNANEKATDPVLYFDRCAKLYAATALVTSPLSYVIANPAMSDLLLYTGSYAISGVICSVLLRSVMSVYGP